MQIFEDILSTQNILQTLRLKGYTVGFVPTMGALHKGHISLVERSKKENSITVVSIFVNPTQFNDKSDYEKYPRTTEKDLAMLREAGCDIVFTPTEKEMYPKPDTRVFDFGNMGDVMEGLHRPGHFNGVAIIVSKLLDIVKPNRLYLGQKDFQQVAIIKELIRQLKLEIGIVPCPTLREQNGLAMSSRNARLTDVQREKAKIIYETLCEIKEQAASKTIEELKSWGIKNIENTTGFLVEYIELACADTLIPIKKINDCDEIFTCVAVKVGPVRLIDNLQIK
jgi:pantoate--beta-alanine ligase